MSRIQEAGQFLVSLRGLDPVATIPRWEDLIDRRLHESRKKPHFVNSVFGPPEGRNFLTIEEESGLEVVYCTTRSKNDPDTSTAVVLQSDQPIKLLEHSERTGWLHKPDSHDARKATRRTFIALFLAVPFTTVHYPAWHGIQPDYKEIRRALHS